VIVYHGEDDRTIKEHYARLFADRLPQDAPAARSGKPHVGFVVTHGHEGVFLKCLRGLVARLPSARFDVTIVCSQPNGEAILRPQIESPTLRYLPIPKRPLDAATAIRAARFDLLYWWEVGTDPANYFLPFFKLAPVQCTSWGWPVTSGIPAMDWFVSCDGLEPPDGDAHYSERLVRLPRLSTYYFRPPVPAVPKPRGGFGFEAGGHLYFCQQNLRKVQPDFDDLIAGILRTDPKGVVAFVADKQPRLSGLLMERLRRRLPDVIDRVRMLPRLAEADYLSLCAVSDVVLDTTRYGGGANTIYDAFAAGTPVVTLPTRFHRGRYCLAAYRQIGLEGAGGVAADPADLVAKAVGFATEPDRRAAFVKTLAERSPALLQDQRAVDDLAEWIGSVIGR
jgi:protein O-GlcNAc transferase